MKNIGIMLLIICCLLQILSVSVNATEPDNMSEATQITTLVEEQKNSVIASGTYSLDALNPLLGTDKRVDNIRSAIVYEANSKTLMYAWNADTQMFPASLVKILTALVAIENGHLDDMVIVSKAAISSIPSDAVSAKLIETETISLKDLLYCLLLGSANDAASVIAEHISGTQSAFVDKMNKYALDMGCAATHFTNPHGIHDNDQYTTARDSAKILDAALANATFKEIFTTKEYTVQPTNLSSARVLTNGNSMMDSDSKLYFDSRVIGGRTGVAKDGRRCLATVAESNGMLVISVVMGAESVYQEDGYTAIRIGGYKETTKLLDICLDGYKTAQVLRAEQILRQIPINGAQNDLMIAAQDSVYSVLPSDFTAKDLIFQYFDKDITLPINKGQHVSDVQIWRGPICIAQAQLVAMNTVLPIGYDQSELPTTENQFIPTIAWILLSIFIAVTAVYLSMRFSRSIRSIFLRMHAKRYRKSHKRTK